MERIGKAKKIAEALRQEPYNLLRNDCITKSLRFKRMCGSKGISAKMVLCLGVARTKWFGHWLVIPVVHGWGEVCGKRIETSRPLESSGLWSIVPVNMGSVIVLRF